MKYLNYRHKIFLLRNFEKPRMTLKSKDNCRCLILNIRMCMKFQRKYRKVISRFCTVFWLINKTLHDGCDRGNETFFKYEPTCASLCIFIDLDCSTRDRGYRQT